MNIRSNAKVAARVAIILLATLGGGFVASSVNAGQADREQRLLDVRRRQLELQTARKTYERAQNLAKLGLVPQTDLDRDEAAVAAAQLNYQQAVLAILDLEPHVSVLSAVKTQTPDGRQFVKVVIANLTPAFDDAQFKLLNDFSGSDPIPPQLRLRSVNDIFVSLRGLGQGTAPSAPQGAAVDATISLPYEIHITHLDYGEKKTLNYQLLRDVDSLAVAISYGDHSKQVPVELQHEGAGGEVRVNSSQASQEADLGSQANYDLTLERPSVDVRSFQLKVVNLPEQVSYSFIDPQTQARLSQINFAAGVSRAMLTLRLFLPDRSDEQVRIDKPIEFWAVALESQTAGRFAQKREYAESEVSAAAGGRIKLVIIPRGVGKLELSAPSLFTEAQAGQSVTTKITVRNVGTRRLDNVNVIADSPPNWRITMTPQVIPSVDVNHDVEIAVRMLPPTDVPVGDYEINFKTESLADGRMLESPTKTYRVSVVSKTNLLGIGTLVGAVVFLLGGAIVFGIKMTRR